MSRSALASSAAPMQTSAPFNVATSFEVVGPSARRARTCRAPCFNVATSFEVVGPNTAAQAAAGAMLQCSHLFRGGWSIFMVPVPTVWSMLQCSHLFRGGWSQVSPRGVRILMELQCSHLFRGGWSPLTSASTSTPTLLQCSHLFRGGWSCMRATQSFSINFSPPTANLPHGHDPRLAAPPVPG